MKKFVSKFFTCLLVVVTVASMMCSSAFATSGGKSTCGVPGGPPAYGVHPLSLSSVPFGGAGAGDRRHHVRRISLHAAAEGL